MSMFSKITTEGVEEAKDVVGGGNYDPIPTGIYEATVKLAYGLESAGGAKGVALTLDVGGKEVRETVYVTNRKGEPYYVDKEDGKTRRPLPGFTNIDELCLLTTETHLNEQNMEDKMVKIYNKEANGEVPTSVPVLVDMLGQIIKVALFRKIENKTKKTDGGRYEPINEFRTINEIVKFMHPETDRTVNEYMQEIEEPVWATEWVNRFGDKDLNKFKEIDGAPSAGTSGTGTPGGDAETSPKKKLFGK